MRSTSCKLLLHAKEQFFVLRFLYLPFVKVMKSLINQKFHTTLFSKPARMNNNKKSFTQESSSLLYQDFWMDKILRHVVNSIYEIEPVASTKCAERLVIVKVDLVHRVSESLSSFSIPPPEEDPVTTTMCSVTRNETHSR